MTARTTLITICKSRYVNLMNPVNHFKYISISHMHHSAITMKHAYLNDPARMGRITEQGIYKVYKTIFRRDEGIVPQTDNLDVWSQLGGNDSDITVQARESEGKKDVSEQN